MYMRLNYLRFLLAWTVLAFHANFFAIPLAGQLAVWCFFLISGFLVSEILYDTYRNRPGDFLKNRFLRIYPVYWVSFALGLALIIFLPHVSREGVANLYWPQAYRQWFWNLTLFGASAEAGFMWTARPAWSLAVEMQWYILLFVGSFIPRSLLLGFFVLVLATPAILHFQFEEKYLTNGAGYCFALGALAYHLKPRIHPLIQGISLALLPLFLFATPLYLQINAFEFSNTWVWLHFMIVPLLLFLALPWLSKKSKTSRLSELTGQLSYPLFLTHTYFVYIFTVHLD
ncbi:MAG: acyltransferase, partial [Halioglobus sp.]|nr:acyltransferase [Halioglobus sp.]